MGVARFKEQGLCSKCGLNPRFISGHNTWCKECLIQGKKTWRKENPEKHNEGQRRRTQNNPETYSAISKRVYTKRVQNGKHLESCGKWRANNPDADKARSHRYIANKRASVGFFTTSEWEAIQLKQLHRCAICKVRAGKFEADHIVPLSKGGCSYAFNIQALCTSCNKTKSDTLTEVQVSLFDRAGIWWA